MILDRDLADVEPELRRADDLLGGELHAGGAQVETRQEIAPERLPELQVWARFWVDSVSAVFLKSYLATAGGASWVPQNQDDLELQLTTMLLEKALYELRYELNLRPDWVRIPLRGILDLVTPA